VKKFSNFYCSEQYYNFFLAEFLSFDQAHLDIIIRGGRGNPPSQAQDIIVFYWNYHVLENGETGQIGETGRFGILCGYLGQDRP
jgi:hypothetical protein